jgi:hypothetical protein
MARGYEIPSARLAQFFARPRPRRPWWRRLWEALTLGVVVAAWALALCLVAW